MKSPSLCCKVPPELLEMIDLLISERLSQPDKQPWTRSDFLRIAVAEKCAKMLRGRSRQGAFRGGQPEEWKPDEWGPLQLPE